MTSRDKPAMADNKPVVVDLVQGKDYFWCACGQSGQQPFCDGTHKGSGFSPMQFAADKDGQAYLCMCKLTKHPPYCDGSHKSIVSAGS